jgi:A/G-specific adenine glycosylase
LPWRAPLGQRADPYAVWLSEIMLQQTTVTAVVPYFLAFLARWPSVENLADAPIEEIMRQWAGLGYYSRARNLHACAREIVTRHGGVFPNSEESLRALPGIGPYTAAAIAAIAFGRFAVVVDGNVERVVARLFAIEVPLPAAKVPIRRRAAGLTPFERPGDYAQAMMDLGATICTPRNPLCALCPAAGHCAGFASGAPGSFPRKAKKPERPVRRGAAVYLRRADKMVLLRRRPPEGLLGGMTEFPGTDWTVPLRMSQAPRDGSPAPAEAKSFAAVMAMLDPSITALIAEGAAPTPARVPGETGSKNAAGARGTAGPGSRELDLGIEHGFTHFRLELEIYIVEIGAGVAAPPGYRWVAEAELDHEALPSVMRKALKAVRRRQAP